MATIYGPFAQDVGAFTDVTFSGPGGTSARVVGWDQADFSSIVGGETWDMTVDGVTKTITLLNTDNSIGAVAANINNEFNPATPAASGGPGGSSLVITGVTDVTIFNVNDPVFALVGLPNFVITAAPMNTRQASVVTWDDATEFLSDPIAVPSGANVCTFWVERRVSGTQSPICDFGFAAAAPGDWGQSPSHISRVVFLPIYDATPVPIGTGPYATQGSYNALVKDMGSYNPGADNTIRKSYTVAIPRGSSHLYAFIGTAFQGGSSDPPTSPPDMRLSYQFAAVPGASLG